MNRLQRTLENPPALVAVGIVFNLFALVMASWQRAPALALKG